MATKTTLEYRVAQLEGDMAVVKAFLDAEDDDEDEEDEDEKAGPSPSGPREFSRRRLEAGGDPSGTSRRLDAYGAPAPTVVAERLRGRVTFPGHATTGADSRWVRR